MGILQWPDRMVNFLLEKQVYEKRRIFNMGLAEGKVIIVTGASSGIGEKTAEVLAAEGAQKRKAGRCGKSYYRSRR